MKKILILPCLLFVIAGAVVAQETTASNTYTTNWKRFTMKGEEFSVILPSLPAMRTNKNVHPRLQKPSVERHFWTAQLGVVYSVDVFENPGLSLNEFIAEQHANDRYDFTTERELTIDGVRGKEYSARDKTSPVIIQLFVTERRLYRFAAKGPENAVVKEFFSAIALRKRDDATQVSDGPGAPLEIEEGEKFYIGSQVDTKARLMSKPEPQYTDKARNAGITGTVVLKAVFDKTGKVTNIHTVVGLPNGLTERCVEAARKIKFIPATKNGKYVSMWIQLEYNFNLK